MVNIKEKAKNAAVAVKKKALPVMVSAGTAMSMVAVNAFAADEATASSSSGFNYSGFIDAFKASFSTLGDNLVIMFEAVLPIGLGIMAMYSMVGLGKKIFTKLTS